MNLETIVTSVKNFPGKESQMAEGALRHDRLVFTARLYIRLICTLLGGDSLQ